MPTVIGQEELYTIKDLSIVAGLAELTLRSRIKDGILKPHIIAGAYVFTRTQVERFLETMDLPPDTIDYRLNKNSNGNGS